MKSASAKPETFSFICPYCGKPGTCDAEDVLAELFDCEECGGQISLEIDLG